MKQLKAIFMYSSPLTLLRRFPECRAFVPFFPTFFFFVGRDGNIEDYIINIFLVSALAANAYAIGFYSDSVVAFIGVSECDDIVTT